jgi:hypothetical protein
VTRAFLRGLAALAFVLIAGLVPAAAQTGQMFGEIVGKVSDAQGGVLPGVTVTLSGPAVMGTQTATSSASGLYRFPGVNSGTYKLTFELAGFAPLVREGVVVPVRQTVTVDAAMKLASLQETVTVSGSSPTVDIENTKVGARLDSATLESVPTSRTIFGSTTVLPGMTMSRQDPGGLNAATSTGMTAHGAGTYNLNYYGVTADTPQNYGSMYYMDFGSAEEISVDTAAMGAEVGGGGGANINVIPKSGGNQVKGTAVYSATGRGYWSGFSGTNVNDNLRAQGIIDPSLQKLNDTNISVGGPFVKDKLWWFGSFRDYNTHENIVGFVRPDNTSLDFLSNLRNYTASAKYQINKNNQFSGFWTYNKKYQPNRGASATQPSPVTTINQQSPKNLFNGNWTSVMGQNTFMEVSSTYFHMHWPSRYSDEFYAIPDAQKPVAFQNTTTGIFSGAEPTGERLRDAYRFQTNVGITRYIDGFLGASHQLKTGFEGWRGWGTDHFDIYGDTRLRVTGANNTPNEIFEFNTPLDQKTAMRNFAAFVQDRASYSNLTFNLGVRWSYYDGSIPAQTGGGGRWFPVTNYPAIDPGYSWNTLAPRLGMIWKLTEDGKNVAKISYSRYFESMYTTEYNSVNPNAIITTGVQTVAWKGDLNGNGTVDPATELGGVKAVSLAKNNSIDPKLRDPKNDEVMVSFQRELMSNVSFSAGWIQRWFRDQTVDEDLGVAGHYIPHNFPDGGPDNLANTADDRSVVFYDVAPGFTSGSTLFHTNFPGTIRYKALEITLAKRMSNRWQMMGSYVWSQNDGDRVLDPTNPNNLVDSQRTGRTTTDQPHAFKLLGSYQAPFGVTLGANYQALSGLPRDRSLSVGLSQGTTTVQVEPRGVYRYDFLNLLSFRADKEFRIGGSRRIGLVAEVHNVLNSNADQNTVGVLTRAFASQSAFDAARATTSYFGRVQEIVAPRILKLGVKFDF